MLGRGQPSGSMTAGAVHVTPPSHDRTTNVELPEPARTTSPGPRTARSPSVCWAAGGGASQASTGGANEAPASDEERQKKLVPSFQQARRSRSDSHAAMGSAS